MLYPLCHRINLVGVDRKICYQLVYGDEASQTEPVNVCLVKKKNESSPTDANSITKDIFDRLIEQIERLIDY